MERKDLELLYLQLDFLYGSAVADFNAKITFKLKYA